MLKSNSVKWRFVKSRDGTYRIIPLNATIYALEQSHNQGDGTGVCVGDYRAYANQKWELELVTEQVAVRLPNGTYIQRTKQSGSAVYKNEAGVALEVNGSHQIIIEPIIITDINAAGNGWHETVSAPFDYTVTGTDKISVSRSGSTLTITGLALGEANITITSGDAQTTVPVVVADKVLDVPLIRQEQSQWCWAACAQMAIRKYEPNNNKIQHWLVEDQRRPDGGQKPITEPDNTAGSMAEVCSIVQREMENIQGRYVSDSQNITDEQLCRILDSGSPVIYSLGKLDNGSRISGHDRIIYGYYMTNNGQYVYLVHEPWNACKQYKEGGALGNNVHRDIWRRSLANIKDEDATGVSGVDRPNTDRFRYEMEIMLFFEEVEA